MDKSEGRRRTGKKKPVSSSKSPAASKKAKAASDAVGVPNGAEHSVKRQHRKPPRPSSKHPKAKRPRSRSQSEAKAHHCPAALPEEQPQQSAVKPYPPQHVQVVKPSAKRPTAPSAPSAAMPDLSVVLDTSGRHDSPSVVTLASSGEVVEHSPVAVVVGVSPPPQPSSSPSTVSPFDGGLHLASPPSVGSSALPSQCMPGIYMSEWDSSQEVSLLAPPVAPLPSNTTTTNLSAPWVRVPSQPAPIVCSSSGAVAQAAGDGERSDMSSPTALQSSPLPSTSQDHVAGSLAKRPRKQKRRARPPPLHGGEWSDAAMSNPLCPLSSRGTVSDSGNDESRSAACDGRCNTSAGSSSLGKDGGQAGGQLSYPLPSRSPTDFPHPGISGSVSASNGVPGSRRVKGANVSVSAAEVSLSTVSSVSLSAAAATTSVVKEPGSTVVSSPPGPLQPEPRRKQQQDPDHAVSLEKLLSLSLPSMTSAQTLGSPQAVLSPPSPELPDTRAQITHTAHEAKAVVRPTPGDVTSPQKAPIVTEAFVATNDPEHQLASPSSSSVAAAKAAAANPRKRAAVSYHLQKPCGVAEQTPSTAIARARAKRPPVVPGRQQAPQQQQQQGPSQKAAIPDASATTTAGACYVDSRGTSGGVNLGKRLSPSSSRGRGGTRKQSSGLSAAFPAGQVRSRQRQQLDSGEKAYRAPLPRTGERCNDNGFMAGHGSDNSRAVAMPFVDAFAEEETKRSHRRTGFPHSSAAGRGCGTGLLQLPSSLGDESVSADNPSLLRNSPPPPLSREALRTASLGSGLLVRDRGGSSGEEAGEEQVTGNSGTGSGSLPPVAADGGFVSAFGDHHNVGPGGGGSGGHWLNANCTYRTVSMGDSPLASNSTRDSPVPFGTLGASTGNRSNSILQQGLLSILTAREDDDMGAMDGPITAQRFTTMREQQNRHYRTQSSCLRSSPCQHPSTASDGTPVAQRLSPQPQPVGQSADGHPHMSSLPPLGQGSGMQRQISFDPQTTMEPAGWLGSSLGRLFSSQQPAPGWCGSPTGFVESSGLFHSTGAMSQTSQFPYFGSAESNGSADYSASAAALAEAPQSPEFPDVNGDEEESSKFHRRCYKTAVTEHSTFVEDPPYARHMTPENVNTFYCVLNHKYVVYQHELGRGSFSRVHLGYNTENGGFYAVKVLDKHRLQKNGLSSESAAQQVQHEIDTMKKLRHHNIVALHEVFNSPSSRKAYLILELAERGEVLSMKGDGTIEPFDDGLPCFEEFIAVRVIRALLQAVMCAHHFGIAHRDIKPSNILLTTEGVVKLSDFGVSTSVGDTATRVQREGSVAFLPPEMLVSSEVEVAPWTPTHSPLPTTAIAGTMGEVGMTYPLSSVIRQSSTGSGGKAGPTATASSHSASLFADSNCATPTNHSGSVDEVRPVQHSTHPSFELSHGSAPRTSVAPSLGSGAASTPVQLYADWLQTCYRQVDLFKADVFAIGVTTFAILMGRLPWSARSAQSQLEAVLRAPDPFAAHYRQAYGRSYETPRSHHVSGWDCWSRDHLPCAAHHDSPGRPSSNGSGTRASVKAVGGAGQVTHPLQPQLSLPTSVVSESVRAISGYIRLNSLCAGSEDVVSSSKQGATPSNEQSSVATENFGATAGSVTSPHTVGKDSNSVNAWIGVDSIGGGNSAQPLPAAAPCSASGPATTTTMVNTSSNSFFNIRNTGSGGRGLNKDPSGKSSEALSASQATMGSSSANRDFLHSSGDNQSASAEVDHALRALASSTPGQATWQPPSLQPLAAAAAAATADPLYRHHEGGSLPASEPITTSTARPATKISRLPLLLRPPPYGPAAATDDDTLPSPRDDPADKRTEPICTRVEAAALPQWQAFHVDPSEESITVSPRAATHTTIGAPYTITARASTVAPDTEANSTVMPPSVADTFAAPPHTSQDTTSPIEGLERSNESDNDVPKPLVIEAANEAGSTSEEANNANRKIGVDTTVTDMGRLLSSLLSPHVDASNSGKDLLLPSPADRASDAAGNDDAHRVSSIVEGSQSSLDSSTNSVGFVTQGILQDKYIRPYTTVETTGLPGVKGEHGYISPEAVDFVRCCLEIDGMHRRSVFELFRHPWIQSLSGAVGVERSPRPSEDGRAADRASSDTSVPVSSDDDDTVDHVEVPVYDIEDEHEDYDENNDETSCHLAQEGSDNSNGCAATAAASATSREDGSSASASTQRSITASPWTHHAIDDPSTAAAEDECATEVVVPAPARRSREQ